MAHDTALPVIESPPGPGGIPYERFLDCVHCGLCTAACPTYLETGNENDSPRGRIYLMRAVTDGTLPLSDKVKRHLDLCLDCRSCETACPSGVQYGRLIEPFRVDMQRKAVEQGTREAPGFLKRTLLYGVFPNPARMKKLLVLARIMQTLKLDRVAEGIGLTRLLPSLMRRMQSILPPLSAHAGQLSEILPAIGPKRARVGLLTGCVADAMFSQTNHATARVLQANGCEVVVPRSQACCGAIHYHSGAGEPALELARQNARAFAAANVDAVIVNAAGCGSMLKDYPHVAHELDASEADTELLTSFSSKVRDIAEFLVDLGPVKPTGTLPIKVVYHDACHLAHAQKIRTQPRDLLAMIPGVEVVPLAESDICCGAAGSYNLTEPEMSDRLAARKRDHILATGAEVVATGNAGCLLQIAASLRKHGSRVRVVHPVDLLDLSYRGKGLPK